MVSQDRISRRELLRLLGIGALGTVVAACAPAPKVEPTQAAATAVPAKATEPPAPTAASTEQGLMQVWIEWGTESPAQLQGLFDKFGAANNVKMEVNAGVEYDKILAALSGTEPPDVLVMGGPGPVGSWQREGLITALDDIIPAAGIDLSDIIPGALGLGRHQGKYYALPWGTDTYALYWNKDLFEDAGLDPEKPPETMEELVAFAEKLTVNDGDDVSQVGFIPDFPWGHGDIYLAMFGGAFYNPDATKVLLTEQPMVDQLKWQQQFYSKYGADKILKLSSALGDYVSPDQGFYAGKVAMYIDGEWQGSPFFIPKYKPELDYGVAPFPYPSDHPERKGTCFVSGTVVMIPSGVKSMEESGKLLAWMLSPEIVAEEMLAVWNLPTSIKAVADPRFHQSEKFEVFIELAGGPNAQSPIYSVINDEVQTEYGQIEEQVLHAGADPEPLLKAAQEKLQPMLDKALAVS